MMQGVVIVNLRALVPLHPIKRTEQNRTETLIGIGETVITNTGR